MNNRKKSFLIYLDNAPMLNALPPEQRGWVLTALMAYGDKLNRGEDIAIEEIMDPLPLSSEGRLVCGFMGTSIRRDTQRWLSRKQSRENSKKAPSAQQPDRQAAEDMARLRRMMELEE